MWVLGPRFVGGGDTQDFGHAFSNYTYFRPCGRMWLSSVQLAQILDGENGKEDEESLVSPPTTMSGGLMSGRRKCAINHSSD